MKKLLFILNLKSGRGQIKNDLPEILDMAVKAGFDVTVRTTQGRGDATSVVEKRAKEFDRIICSGGDGTLDEVVTGLEFLDKLEDLLQFLIPNYIKEGKNSLVIGIGCTGGKHRSVTLTNEIYKRLSQNKDNYGLKVLHRDIERDRKILK